jgi:flagellar hook-length control protein FliK
MARSLLLSGDEERSMQPSLPVALPAPITATPSIGKVQLGSPDFGGALSILLAAIASTATTATQSPTLTAGTGQAPPATQKLPPDTLTTTEIPLSAALSPPTSETPAATSKLQSDAATAKPRALPTTRREQAKPATNELLSSEPVAAGQPPSAVPVVVLPNNEVPSLVAPAASPIQDDAGAVAQAPTAAKSVSPQPVTLQPGGSIPTMDAAVTTAIHERTVISNAVANADATQTVAATLASPASFDAPASATAAPTSATAAPGTASTSHPTPAAQIAPALVSLGHAPDGAQRLTMKLEPPDLGQVQIRIDQATTDTPARVAITVEKPETLALLLRDQPQLQRALDQAGVPAEGRSVTFHVATPAPAARTDTATAPQPTGSTASMSGDLSHGASRQGGRPTQQNVVSSDDTEEVEAVSAPEPTWMRAGLDITA